MDTAAAGTLNGLISASTPPLNDTTGSLIKLAPNRTSIAPAINSTQPIGGILFLFGSLFLLMNRLVFCPYFEVGPSQNFKEK